AIGAGAGYALCEAAVVAAQRAVDLVKDPEGAAVGALAFPGAGVAGQHRGVAAPVEQYQALFATRHALLHRRQQRRRERGALGLVVHVHHAQAGQAAAADAPRHFQPRIAPLFARVPALQRGRGRAQDDLAALAAVLRLDLGAVDREVARRVARAFLALVARVVLLVHDDEPQARQAGEDGHARPQ